MIPPRFLLACLLLAASALRAADPLPGHSLHGEAFNEGPRQEAHLMEGTGKVSFAVSTSKPLAQRFFNQGVGQLHGFWYYEAERSFRQAAKLDPDCAMAYWGMAMANINNQKRARGFIAKAVERKDKADAREQLWIAMFDNYLKEDKRTKNRRELDCIGDIEKIVQQHPEDIEAKAFLAWKIWHGKGDAPISSPMAVQALLDQVFAAEPAHPAHHYSIHLWDGFKPEQGLKSAAACGPAAPGIAHMWHMPGHIYSKLRRYDDAAWQQEASTRVDHAYMIANFVQPDQIHNYAHNEEWLIRTFNELGQAGKAEGLARALIANPQHPANNTLDKSGCSASYGRTRLIETLIKWEKWPELLAVCADNSRLAPQVQQVSHEVTRLRALGLAHFAQESATELAKVTARLAELDKTEAEKAKKAQAKPAEAGKPEAKDAPKEDKPASTPDTVKADIIVEKPAAVPQPSKPAAKPATPAKTRPTETALKELRLLEAVLAKSPDAAKTLGELKNLDKILAARCWLHLGDKAKAEETAKSFAQDLASLIAKADILDRCGKQVDARGAFTAAQKAAFAMDAELPAAQRLKELAQKFGIKSWKAAPPKRSDLGQRPPLDSLGPLHWSPPAAPTWSAFDFDGQTVTNGATPGGAQLLVFYLGSDCTHCVEQLNALAKQAQDFAKLGIALHAISPQSPKTAPQIHDKLPELKDPKAIHFLCDPSLDAFKAFRAHDDFENEALHAVVLLDGSRRIRWMDISYQPFTDVGFLVKEARRLLAIDPAAP